VEGVADQFRTFVTAEVRRGRVKAGEFVQHSHHVLGLKAPSQPDGGAEAAVLVDHAQELEPPTNGGGIELEVHRPTLMRVLGLVTPRRGVG